MVGHIVATGTPIWLNVFCVLKYSILIMFKYLLLDLFVCLFILLWRKNNGLTHRHIRHHHHLQHRSNVQCNRVLILPFDSFFIRCEKFLFTRIDVYDCVLWESLVGCFSFTRSGAACCGVCGAFGAAAAADATVLCK